MRRSRIPYKTGAITFSLLLIVTGVFAWALPHIAKAAPRHQAAKAVALATHNAWSADQDNCNDLYPTSTAPQTKPANYGAYLTDIFHNNAQAHWKYDGVHSITACSNGPNGNLVKDSSGQPSLSGEAYRTGGYGAAWQCMELITRYAYSRWGDDPLSSANWPGVASEVWDTHPSHFNNRRYDNGGTVAPQAGDILIFGYADTQLEPVSNYAGHIAIITSVNYQDNVNGYPTVTIMEQNLVIPPNGVTHAFHKEYLRISNGTYTIGGAADSDGYYMPNWNDKFVSRYPITSQQPDTYVYGWLDDPSGGPSANPTYNSHEVYVIGANHHLYNYEYKYTGSGTKWVITDLSVASNTTSVALQGTPAGDYSAGVHFVYAVSTTGDLYEFDCANTSNCENPTNSWHAADLSHNFAHDATFTGSPQAYSFTDPAANNTLHHAVNVVAPNGHLWSFDYHYPANWVPTDVSYTSKVTATFTGTPSGYVEYFPALYSEYLYDVASDGQIYVFGVESGQTWGLAQTDSLPSGVKAVGSPSSYGFIADTDNGPAEYDYLYVEGDNGHLYALQSNPVWTTTDVNDPTVCSDCSGITLTGSPQAHISYQNPSLDFVYAVDSNGNLEEYYTVDNSGKWSRVNLGNSGNGYVATGSAWAYSYVGPNSTLTVHMVFHVESDGHLHEQYYDTSWHSADLGAPAGTTLNGSSPNAYGFLN